MKWDIARRQVLVDRVARTMIQRALCVAPMHALYAEKATILPTLHSGSQRMIHKNASIPSRL